MTMLEVKKELEEAIFNNNILTPEVMMNCYAIVCDYLEMNGNQDIKINITLGDI